MKSEYFEGPTVAALRLSTPSLANKLVRWFFTVFSLIPLTQGLASGPWGSSGLWRDKAAWTAEEWDIQSIQGQFYRLNRVDRASLEPKVAKMNVSLPKDLEEFVLKEVVAGEDPNQSDVVVEALREFRGRRKDGSPEEESSPGNVRRLLLEAVNGPHHPMPADYFDKLRARLRASFAK